MSDSLSAASSGTFHLGGDLPVHRLGFGAMRITGPGIWGPPRDHAEAVRVLRRAVDLGVTLIDTADSYGPYVSEDLIAEALAPYPDDLVVATKGGLLRTGPNQWPVCGRPDYLRQCVEMSLRRLKLDQIPLYQLHRIDPDVPADEQFGVLKEMQDAGKVRHVGLSEVSVEEVEAARHVLPVVSVQNEYNLGTRKSEAVLDYCEAEGIAFIPWFPLDAGKLSGSDTLAEASAALSATPSQVALAWLLKRSPVMLPIPGTSSVEHLDENVGGAAVEMTDEWFSRLDRAATAG
ncbi:MAG TPA: aldo/keto reductase [Rubricoccaceae bacterium]|jgi:aryl-alcohol dehydrogenase-like predicted oxidoreductase